MNDEHECKQAQNIKTLWEKMDKVNTVLFEGNSKPSIQTQLATIQLTLRALTWVTGVVAAALIAQVVSLIFKGG